MIVLRNFTKADAFALQRIKHPNLSIEQIEALIHEWNLKQVNSKYFEMFAILLDENIVGTISLYQHSAEVISIGPEIFKPYRQKGLAKEAMICACTKAKEKGYKIVFQQIRTNNVASIALHSSLGFETNGLTYTNAKGNQVAIYLKSLI
ncbi:MAG: GNAT family N-acetyltransferase [Ruminococcaceae bacterium]|nr:GNAT family N-acetyltransferase [Oscillospiraceae bacterium]